MCFFYQSIHTCQYQGKAPLLCLPHQEQAPTKTLSAAWPEFPQFPPAIRATAVPGRETGKVRAGSGRAGEESLGRYSPARLPGPRESPPGPQVVPGGYWAIPGSAPAPAVNKQAQDRLRRSSGSRRAPRPLTAALSPPATWRRRAASAPALPAPNHGSQQPPRAPPPGSPRGASADSQSAPGFPGRPAEMPDPKRKLKNAAALARAASHRPRHQRRRPRARSAASGSAAGRRWPLRPFPFTGRFHRRTSQGASEGRRGGRSPLSIRRRAGGEQPVRARRRAGGRGFSAGRAAHWRRPGEGAWRGGGEGDAHPSSSAREAIRGGGAGPVPAGGNGLSGPSAAAGAAGEDVPPLPGRGRQTAETMREPPRRARGSCLLLLGALLW